MSAGNQRVMVAVRVRPMLREGSHLQAQEKFELQAVHRTGDTALRVELTRPGEPAKYSMFTFDYIFDQESTQLEVYEDAVVDMVDACLVGVNATLLAYGQTGSGKTFTVLGDVKPNPLENDLLTSESGMFLRVLSDLMDYKIRQAKKGWHVVIGISCMEIYNENIRDLFGGKPGSAPPPLKAVMIGDDVLLPSLIIKEMTTLQAVFNEIQLAISRRKSRATEANTASSRSHCLFTIDILQQAASAPPPSVDLLDSSKKSGDEKPSARRVNQATPNAGSPKANARNSGNANSPNAADIPPYEMPFHGTVYRIPGQKEPIYSSKIILADLAGSERIARSGVTGEGLTEATSINSSLTALGNVVHSLHEGGYVSYRTSNLTRLLKPTFSQPSSRVLLLAQCAPTQLTFDETISTLHFANKVKAMKVTTTSGAEAEKLQFDFLETEKTYDSIVADLHIFAVELYANPAVIRRKLTQHGGLYYDAHPRAKASLKERRASVDALGALEVAQTERAAILAAQEDERNGRAASQAKEVAEARSALVKEYKDKMEEAQEAMAVEKNKRLYHATQMTVLDAAAIQNRTTAEEDASWSALMLSYLREHRVVCERELATSSALFDSLLRELNNQRLQGAGKETPEIIAQDTSYALSTWGHCTAKRFFSSCMELCEDQVCYWSISHGNDNLESWREKNQEAIRKVANEE